MVALDLLIKLPNWHTVKFRARSVSRMTLLLRKNRIRDSTGKASTPPRLFGMVSSFEGFRLVI